MAGETKRLLNLYLLLRVFRKAQGITWIFVAIGLLYCFIRLLHLYTIPPFAFFPESFWSNRWPFWICIIAVAIHMVVLILRAFANKTYLEDEYYDTLNAIETSGGGWSKSGIPEKQRELIRKCRHVARPVFPLVSAVIPVVLLIVAVWYLVTLSG